MIRLHTIIRTFILYKTMGFIVLFCCVDFALDDWSHFEWWYWVGSIKSQAEALGAVTSSLPVGPWHTSAWWDPVITVLSFYHLMESIKEATAFTWLGMSNKFLSLVSLMWFLIYPHALPDSFHPQNLPEPFLRIKSYISLCYVCGGGQWFYSGIWSSSTSKMWLVL